jgi:hypothetical protein
MSPGPVAASGLKGAEKVELKHHASTNTWPAQVLTSLDCLSMLLKCLNCGSEIPDTEEKCPTCGFNAGPPNVRAAASAEEAQALEERYQQAFDTARTKGHLPQLERFDDALKQTSAIINFNLNFLHFFVTGERNLYATYEHGAGKTRKPAPLVDDQKRRAIGSTLFGGYAHEIIYAALSLDGSGPQSYGLYAVKLREIAIVNRATVLEDNSYDFVRKHDLLKSGNKPPPGYIATWANRHKLAVAKLAERITPGTKESDFASLLLFSEGNRATDDFIEVHIYGTFDPNAIESVKGSSTVGRDERVLLRLVKQHLKNAGKEWIEG